MYLHCDAIVCIASENIKECDRTCNNTKPNSTAAAGRRKREAGVYYVYTDSKPIILYSTGPSVRGKILENKYLFETFFFNNNI